MIYCGDCGSGNPEDKQFCWKCGKPLHIEMVRNTKNEATGKDVHVPTFQDLPPAPLGKRLMAFIIDVVVIWIIYFVLRLFIPERISLAGLGVPFAYFVLLGTFTGTSLGKYALGLCLVKRDGTAPGLLRVAARYFGMFLLSPLWIAWWTVSFRKDRRAIHDIASGTMLVARHAKNRLVTGFAVLLFLTGILGIILIYDPFLYRAVSGLLDGSLRRQIATQMAQLSAVTADAKITETRLTNGSVATQNSAPTASQIAAPITPMPTNTPRPSATDTPTLSSLWVCASLAYGYDQPSEKSSVVWQMASYDGWSVVILEQSGMWFKVQSGTRTAWMRSADLCPKRPVTYADYFATLTAAPTRDPRTPNPWDVALANAGIATSTAPQGSGNFWDEIGVPRLTIPAGMGGIAVDNFCGFDVNLDIAGKLYTIPVNKTFYIYLPPGHYPVSATAAGTRLTCGGSGCSLDVETGLYTPYPYCARPPE